MIVNCYGCGKSISTKITNCVYCKHEVIALDMNPAKGLTGAHVSLVERLKGSLLSLVLR